MVWLIESAGVPTSAVGGAAHHIATLDVPPPLLLPPPPLLPLHTCDFLYSAAQFQALCSGCAHPPSCRTSRVPPGGPSSAATLAPSRCELHRACMNYTRCMQHVVTLRLLCMPGAQASAHPGLGKRPSRHPGTAHLLPAPPPAAISLALSHTLPCLPRRSSPAHGKAFRWLRSGRRCPA